MLYDLGVRAPPKSRLESVLMVVAHRRQTQAFYQTKVLVEANLAPHRQDSGKALQEALKKYAEAMMPFLAKLSSEAEVRRKKNLELWTGQGPIVIRPRPVPRLSGQGRAAQSELERRRKQVLAMEQQKKRRR